MYENITRMNHTNSSTFECKVLINHSRYSHTLIKSRPTNNRFWFESNTITHENFQPLQNLHILVIREKKTLRNIAKNTEGSPIIQHPHIIFAYESEHDRLWQSHIIPTIISRPQCARGNIHFCFPPFHVVTQSPIRFARKIVLNILIAFAEVRGMDRGGSAKSGDGPGGLSALSQPMN